MSCQSGGLAQQEEPPEFSLCSFVTHRYLTIVSKQDESLNAFYKLRTIYYEVWFNCFLVAGLCFAKTSIGVAILRISIHKKYDYMIYAILAVSNLAFVALFIWLLSSCTPVAARWNPLLGTCHTEGLLPMVYMTTTVAFVTDAGCAIIPVMILRELLLPRKTKYALMGVLATGGVTVVIAVARFPFIKYLDTGSSRVNALCQSNPLTALVPRLRSTASLTSHVI